MTLEQLVAEYQNQNAYRLKKIVDDIKEVAQGDIPGAIERSLFDNKRVYAHQRRIGKKVLNEAKQELMKLQSQFEDCSDFDEILALVSKIKVNRFGVNRFGALCKYDTALRLGVYFDKYPNKVYLHAGAKIGAKNLGFTKKDFLKKDELPEELHSLEEYQIENFLCVMKDKLSELCV